VDWDALSDRGAWILVKVEVPVSIPRVRVADVAERLGVKKAQVAALRQELRDELAGLMASPD
jgi:hypothetical protein